MISFKTLVIPAFSAALLMSCSAPDETAQAPADTSAPATTPASDTTATTGRALPAMFDCVRENNGLLIAAHRGGPAAGYPENAIETFQHALDKGIRVLEIDVAESRDGTLFLMHDRSLGRTTTGDGPVADMAWDDISKLNLVDNDGTVTRFAPPTLANTLDWAVKAGAIVELDRKPTTSFRNIIESVRTAGAENNVIMITYDDDEAWQVAKLAPDLMMTAGIGDFKQEAALLAGGVSSENLIAWTGTSRPSPGKWKGLASKNIESAFGTLGRADERLDDIYWADGNPSEYQALISGGLTMLATDRPYELAKAGGEIADAISAGNACAR